MDCDGPTSSPSSPPCSLSVSGGGVGGTINELPIVSGESIECLGNLVFQPNVGDEALSRNLLEGMIGIGGGGEDGGGDGRPSTNVVDVRAVVRVLTGLSRTPKVSAILYSSLNGPGDPRRRRSGGGEFGIGGGGWYSL